MPAFRSLVPMLPVADVERSIAFYMKLGFEVRNTFQPGGAAAPTWAWLESGGGAQLMLAGADPPPEPGRQGVLFYLYCDDVAAAHAELRAAGVEVGPITHPFYCPKGEFRMVDADGHVLMIGHT